MESNNKEESASENKALTLALQQLYTKFESLTVINPPPIAQLSKLKAGRHASIEFIVKNVPEARPLIQFLHIC